MDRWADKVAVVTGASAGIGEAVVRKLVEHGMIVVGLARRVEKLEQLKSQLPADRFHALKCDVSSEKDIIEAFRTIDQKLQRVDVLINNAGVANMTSLIDPSAEALHTLFNTNCVGACLCTREALHIMKQRNIQSGYIIYTNSVVGHSIMPISHHGMHIYPYTATKYALKAIAEGLRQELRAQGSKIRVGEVSPGMVETEIALSFDAHIKKHEKTAEVKQDPKDAMNAATANMRGKLGEVVPMKSEDIADAFVYMLSAPERADVNEIIINHIGQL